MKTYKPRIVQFVLLHPLGGFLFLHLLGEASLFSAPPGILASVSHCPDLVTSTVVSEYVEEHSVAQVAKAMSFEVKYRLTQL